MIKRILPYLKWLIPILFLVMGISLLCAVHGHGFLGIMCLCIAGVVICYFALALLHNKHPRAADIAHTVLTVSVCIFLLLFTITEVFIIRASTGQPNADCQYVLVLGAKVDGTAPSYSLQDRIDLAYSYLNTHKNTIAVLTGGKGEDEEISEARCIYNELVNRSIDADRLWLEEEATSTWENITFSLALIEEKTGNKPESIGILSSEYHMFRAGLFAEKNGVQAVGIPAATTNPTIRLNYFLREVGGVWHYLVLGGQYHD